MKRFLSAAIAALVVTLGLPAGAAAIDNVNTQQLRGKVTLGGILEHEQALQNIAIAHEGNRAATTAGYKASVDYVAAS